MMTDPIADLLARIRNAALARHDVTRLPANRVKKHIAELLKAEGYISDVRQEEWGPQKHQTLTIVLKYSEDRTTSAFQGLRRVSRPGRRVYVRHDQNPACLERARHVDPQHLAGADVGQGSAPSQGGRRAPV